MDSPLQPKYDLDDLDFSQFVEQASLWSNDENPSDHRHGQQQPTPQSRRDPPQPCTLQPRPAGVYDNTLNFFDDVDTVNWNFDISDVSQWPDVNGQLNNSFALDEIDEPSTGAVQHCTLSQGSNQQESIDIDALLKAYDLSTQVFEQHIQPSAAADASSDASWSEPDDTDESHGLRHQVDELRGRQELLALVTKPLPLRQRRRVHQLAHNTGMFHCGLGSAEAKPVLLSKCDITGGSGRSYPQGSFKDTVAGFLDLRVLSLRVYRTHEASPRLSSFGTVITPMTQVEEAQSMAPETVSATHHSNNTIALAKKASDGIVTLRFQETNTGSANMAGPTHTNLDRTYLKGIVKAAKHEAIRMGRPDFAATIVGLYRQTKNDGALARLLDEFLTQQGSTAPNNEFMLRLQAARKTAKEARERKRLHAPHVLEPENVKAALLAADLPRPHSISQNSADTREVFIVYADPCQAASVLTSVRNGCSWLQIANSEVYCEYLHFQDNLRLAAFQGQHGSLPQSEDHKNVDSSQPTPSTSSQTLSGSNGTPVILTMEESGLPGPKVAPKRKRSPSVSQGWKCAFPSCVETFRTDGERRKHQLTHQERNHLCDICGKAFLYAKDVKRHRDNVHKK